MNTLKKAMIGTAAATAMAVSAAPAQAGDRYDDGGISAGEVIAGAVVIGGLAAILSSGKKDRYNQRYDRGDYYRGSRSSYGRRGISSRRAVDRCVRAAERQASYYGKADVTDIRDVDRTRYGYRVKGRIAVRDNYRGRNYRSRYNRGGYDKGKFSCYISRGRVTDVNFSGLKNKRRYYRDYDD